MRWIAYSGLTLLAAVGRLPAAETLLPALKVMSFNLRYATPEDGEDQWDNRRALAAETVSLFGPDLLGIQEGLDFQVAYLEERLPDYAVHGRGREADGSGEQSALFYRRDRFELLDAGHFWLSETPDVPGSRSWDSACVRLCSWVKLRDRRAGGATLLYLNTHWDHLSEEARLESARLMRTRLEALDPSLPVIVTGDFNTTEDRPPYDLLVLQSGARGRLLFDSFRELHPEPGADEGTFNDFGRASTEERIDWILHSAHFVPLRAEIDRLSENGHYPSDHYPVEVVLRLRP